MRRVVLASSNRGKLEEMAGMFAGFDIDLVTQGDLDVGDADETGLTFVENALIKARHAARATGLAAVADDSGICVDALGGAPGLYSARYAGTHRNDAANNAKLLEALADVPDERRGAHFHCTIVLLRHADDPAPLIAEGLWRGTILRAPQGSHGFGYQPLFFDPALGVASAELDTPTRNRVSHRGLAMAKLRQMLAAGTL
ncbi:MAG TPA: RdgB/HAM1 family non-canonical purine NTP pyrophosphatase [Tahibacter sp.]|nr:RdgB/HAM1 family non-canonical purine NTP pyrophosphatase [Tahibacter sp.]